MSPDSEGLSQSVATEEGESLRKPLRLRKISVWHWQDRRRAGRSAGSLQTTFLSGGRMAKEASRPSSKAFDLKQSCFYLFNELGFHLNFVAEVFYVLKINKSENSALFSCTIFSPSSYNYK